MPGGVSPGTGWEWVRRELREQAPVRGLLAPWSLNARLAWATGTVGLAVALTAAGWLALRGSGPGRVGEAGEAGTEVEWVETDRPDAVSMVYQDPATGWTVIWVAAEEEAEGDAG